MAQDKTYLRFDELPNPRKATKKWRVYADLDLTELGWVEWFVPWRRYVFQPDGAVLFDAACLRELADFLDTQTGLQKIDAALRKATRP